MTIKQKHHEQKEKVQIQAHNRVKQYILKEGVPVPFLIDLGVMNEQGKIIHARYDKFRQINRFLEFIEDILPRLSRDREITILDFGCGKSYLTFAMYYYLKLTREVREHNNFARRVPILEEQMKVANHRIADLEHNEKVRN